MFKSEAQSREQLGQTIEGEAFGDRSGLSVSLSASGLVLAAAGARHNDGNDERERQVRTYKFGSNTQSWEQVGQDLDRANENDESGSSLDLSADGTVLVSRSPPHHHGPGEGLRLQTQQDFKCMASMG